MSKAKQREGRTCDIGKNAGSWQADVVTGLWNHIIQVSDALAARYRSRLS